MEESKYGVLRVSEEEEYVCEGLSKLITVKCCCEGFRVV